jgi:hypothetical protein
MIESTLVVGPNVVCQIGEWRMLFVLGNQHAEGAMPRRSETQAHRRRD